MDDSEFLNEQFEAHRARLRSVAYRMLGSTAEADDALQQAWMRVDRADASEVENLGGWLTTIVARVCLNMLRSRRTRREDLAGTHVPDPIVTSESASDPEHEAVLADCVGLALLVVLETLSPAERLAFVLHDMFAVPFDEIAPMVGRTPTAARQLASRARSRVRDVEVHPEKDLARQREVVDAFFAAARHGDFDALVAVLDPDVILRSDGGELNAEASVVLHGAVTVASRAMRFSNLSPFARRAVVNGAPGVVVAPDGRVASVMSFTVANGKIVAITVLADPERLARLDLSALDPADPGGV